MAKNFFKEWKNQIIGFVLIILAGVLYLFRPFQDCSLWKGIPIISGLACEAAGGITTVIILIIAIILIIVGIRRILR